MFDKIAFFSHVLHRGNPWSAEYLELTKSSVSSYRRVSYIIRVSWRVPHPVQSAPEEKAGEQEWQTQQIAYGSPTGQRRADRLDDQHGWREDLSQGDDPDDARSPGVLMAMAALPAAPVQTTAVSTEKSYFAAISSSKRTENTCL